MLAYIATSLGNAAVAEALAAWLLNKNTFVSYLWWKHGSMQHVYGTHEGVRTAILELDGVRNANFVILFLPGGFGAHCELGMALALGKPVFLIGDRSKGVWNGGKGYECIFYRHPLVRTFKDVQAFYAAFETGFLDQPAVYTIPVTTESK